MPLSRPTAVLPLASDRRRHGVYLTPPELVDAVLDLALPLVPPGAVTVVDPACGDGAFLAAAAARLPRARLVGLELSEALAQTARARVRRAQVLVGDGLREGWTKLQAALAPGAVELWLGNPPYNGTSPLLGDPPAYAALRARVGLDGLLPRGTSLRDDFAFFLLLAAHHLQRRRGVLAWVTSATLLDAFLYAPLRRHLLGSLGLEHVVDLGPGAFSGTRVRTCITVWQSPATGRPVAFRERRSLSPLRLGGLLPFVPEGPEWNLRPTSAAARTLDARWRERGEPLDQLVPVHCTGLKTRFDELLVDADAEALLRRVDAFLAASPRHLRRFAEAFGLPARLVPKLEALRGRAGLPSRAERSAVRPFFRYAGARHRSGVPDSARAFCYLDRRLIPRGDHRLTGRFDPHVHPCKLVFNVRELPLSAALLDAPGCIPAHRHARFAPLEVPARVWAFGPAVGRREADLGPSVLNLSLAGRAWAHRLGDARSVFERIVAFVNSPAVQEVWAPAFGRSRTLPIPLDSVLEITPGMDFESPAGVGGIKHLASRGGTR